MEEPDEEGNTSIQYSSEPRSGKVSWVLNKRLRLGKQILIAGFVVSSAPVVLPPLVVVSAIGLAVSVPYGFFLASHVCTEKLMSKLLPRPTTPPPVLFYSTVEEEKEERVDLEEVCFRGDVDVEKEEQELQDETKRRIQMRIEMVDDENVNNEEKNMMLGNENDYGQGVVKEDEPELSHSQDTVDVIQDNGSKEDNSDYIREEEKTSPEKHANVKLGTKRDDGMEGRQIGESKGEQPMIGGHGVVITIEGLDKIGNDIEEFKTPFQVTSVALEEFEDQAIEGDIEEAELKRETKGLLEKIRDEGRADSGGEYEKGIHGGTNEGDQKIGPVVENKDIAWEDNHSCTTIAGIDERTDTMGLLVASMEHKFRPSECSSGKDNICPSQEVAFNEENIRKYIHAIRKIVGYEGAPQASCAEELRALYIFTGVEAPNFLKENSAEINEKLHFLMSIVGIKSNTA